MTRSTGSDRGTVLPIVLVVSVVLGAVVVGIATYAAATLRLGQVVEESSDRLAAAEGGLDWALDRLGQPGQPVECATAVGTSTDTFPDLINGISPVVRCQQIGNSFTGYSDYAIVMTGEEATEELLRAQGGGASANATKEIFGPIYIENPTFDLLANVEIVDGFMLYRDLGCRTEAGPAPLTLPGRLTFQTPNTGPVCTDQSWATMFAPNAPQPNLPTTDAPPSVPDLNGCRVWFPGRYDTAPDFSSELNPGAKTYNYFVSGEYHFDNAGEINLSGAYVLMGYPGPAGPNIVQITPQDTFENHPCRAAWWYDGLETGSEGAGTRGDRRGASVYLSGNSSIFVSQGSAIEVTGRTQSTISGTRPARVALQVLNTTTVRGDGEVLTTKGGSGSQVSMNGLVWAPYSSVNFNNIANDVVAALRGGAVVSTIEAGAAAQTDGFLIQVDGVPSQGQLLLESTATNSGSVTVQAIVDFRPSPRAFAVDSRQVLGLTPG